MDDNDGEGDREAKKQRQKKKMTKILIKAWNLDADANPFIHAEELSASDMEYHKTGPMNLASMGEKLDAGVYEFGITGWENFALDLSWIYRRFIMSGKNSKLGQIHLKEIQGLLENISPSLSDIAQGDADEKNKTITSSKVSKRRAVSPIKDLSQNNKERKSPPKVSPKKKRKIQGKKKPNTQQTQREVKSELSKLQKELDKVIKAHEKATKNLEIFLNETNDGLHSLEEEGIHGEEDKEHQGPNPRRVLGNYDFDIFQDMPSICAPDILIVWDFLCTFGRTLSLEPIGLDDFVKALLYSPKQKIDEAKDHNLTPPLYLAEAHLALLKLLLTDISSDDWWYSMVENSGFQTASSTDVDTSVTDIHNIAPLIKIDVYALLTVPEDPIITNQWLKELELLLSLTKLSSRKVNNALKKAMSTTLNKYVKYYIYKCIQKRRLSESIMKDAVNWLVSRVREARLDLQNDQVEENFLMEHILKVAQDSKEIMDQLQEEDDDEEIDLDRFDDWDDLLESEDELESDNEDELQQSREGSRFQTAGQADESAQVISSVPELPTPALGDILLPSNKHTTCSEILSPFSWPPIAGISARRILYRFKWLRNGVDDSLREFREKPRLTISERKRRELIAPFRILSECVSFVEAGDHNPLESAIIHLCEGRPYLDLRPVQRLCILRLLVEASYDTDHIYNCVQDNIKSRTSAEKSLEQEERQLKKEAKEEAAVVEESAKARLLEDAKRSFIELKRKELAQSKKGKRGYTEQQIMRFSDDQIASYDEDTKLAFDSLNTQTFSKADVSAMVSTIIDENAFGKKSVEILSLEELQLREEKELASMLEELLSFGNFADNYDRSVSARIDKLRKEISNYQEWMISLPKRRSDAIVTLKDAIQDGTMKVLKSAIRNAKDALLMGDVNDGDGIWAFDLLRDAFLELKAAERRKRVIDAQKDLIGKRNKCFIRTEPIGSDRYLSKYWHFDHDIAGRIWVEAEFELGNDSKGNISTGLTVYDTKPLIVGPGEEEEDFLPSDAMKTNILTKFISQEYHQSSFTTSLVKRSCGFYVTEKSLRSLIKNMDSKRKREVALKEELKKILESSGVMPSTNDETSQNLATFEDSYAFEQGKTLYLSSLVDEDGFAKDCLANLSSAVGLDILLTQTAGSADDTSDLRFKVSQFQMKTDVNNLTLVPTWLATSDVSTAVELSCQQLFDGIIRASKRDRNNQEDLSSLSDYRNKLGKFCGRAAEAPYAMTVFSLSKLLLKREQDLYPSLKCRLMGTDNQWGGKNGLKNAWIVSLRDYGDRFETVKECCLLLESAFFEFCGGVNDNFSDEVVSSAMHLLNDPKGRRNVALETKGSKISGLWPSKESRWIFRELVSSSMNVGILALCIELLCINCRSYLGWTKSNLRNVQDYGDSSYQRVTRGTITSQALAEQTSGSRRMNAWQQQQGHYY